MPTLNKIFAVIDPTTDKQSALTSAMRIVAENKAIVLHAYAAIQSSGTNTDPAALQRVETARHLAWIESLVAPVRAAGNEVKVEVEWTTDWRSAIVRAANSANADLVIKAAGSHSGAGRRVLQTSDWALLRQAHCPVYLIKKGTIESGANVLVAIDIARKDDLHSKLNERVLEFGRALVDSIPNSNLYAVNAYESSEKFVSPSDLAHKAGIIRTHAHTVDGTPEKVIAAIAELVKADIVVIGTAARDGLKAAVIGNTAEKILDAIASNLLTVNTR